MVKALARSYVWWAKIDVDIERMVSLCKVCQSMRSNPPSAPVHPSWTFPSHPWSHLHVDFAGLVAGRMYLVLVDAYSKYPDVVKMNTTTSSATISVLREVFSRQGLPEILVSDNGPQFTSTEFQEFCALNGIRHRTSSPYKPSTNGQAERVVQILKTALKQAHLTGTNVDTVLPRYLLRYRNTPHSTTGESPAVLLMERRLCTRLDLLTPSVHKHVEAKQQAVVERTSDRQLRNLQVGDHFLARNYSDIGKWMQGIVAKVLGSRHYMVNIQGQLWKRHIDQLIKIRVNEQSGCLTRFPVNDLAGIESESVSGSPVTSTLPDTVMSLQNSRSLDLAAICQQCTTRAAGICRRTASSRLAERDSSSVYSWNVAHYSSRETLSYEG